MCHPNGVPCIFVHCIMCMCMCLAGRRLPQRHSLRRGVPSQVRRSRWRVVRSSCARYCYRPLHPRAASPLRLPRPAPPRLASPRPASPRFAPPRPASLRLAPPRLTLTLTRGVSRSRRCLTLTLTLPLTRRCLFGEYRLPLLRTPYMLIGAPHMPCIQCVAVIGAPSQSSMRTHPCKCSACTLHVLYTACALLVHCTGAQFDTYQLDHDLGQCGHWGCEPRGAAELEYAWRFATATARFGHRLAVGQRLVYSSR